MKTANKYAGREKEYMHEYYLLHKQRMRAANKAWKAEHIQETKAYRKEYGKKNSDAIKEYKKRWWNANREALRSKRAEYAREKYHNDPAYRDKALRNARLTKSRYPDAAIAHRKVRNALEKGALTREGCEVCGAEPTEAHHDDYNYPLKVRWLCRTCHAEWHRKNKPIRKEQESA